MPFTKSSSKPHKTTISFAKFPLELQLAVVKELSTDTLIEFRESCSQFFHLTNLHTRVVDKPSKKNSRTIFYSTSQKRILTNYQGDKHVLVEPPNSTFMNNVFNITLDVKNVLGPHQDYFMEELLKLQLKLSVVKLGMMTESFLELLMNYFENVPEIHIYCWGMCPDKFLLTDFKKYEADVRYIYASAGTRVPTEGLHHVMKSMLTGSFKLTKFNYKPLTHFNTVSIFKDITCVNIFNIKRTNGSLLNVVDKNMIYRFDEDLNEIGAVRDINTGKCLIIRIYKEAIEMEKCEEKEIIQHIFTHDLYYTNHKDRTIKFWHVYDYLQVFPGI